MLTSREITEKFDALILPGLDVPGITTSNMTVKFKEYKAAKAALEAEWGEWLRQKYVPTLNSAAANVILQKVLENRYADYINLEFFYEKEAKYINAILTAQQGFNADAINAQVQEEFAAAHQNAINAVRAEKNAPDAVKAVRHENLLKWVK